MASAKCHSLYIYFLWSWHYGFFYMYTNILIPWIFKWHDTQYQLERKTTHVLRHRNEYLDPLEPPWIHTHISMIKYHTSHSVSLHHYRTKFLFVSNCEIHNWSDCVFFASMDNSSDRFCLPLKQCLLISSLSCCWTIQSPGLHTVYVEVQSWGPAWPRGFRSTTASPPIGCGRRAGICTSPRPLPFLLLLPAEGAAAGARRTTTLHHHPPLPSHTLTLTHSNCTHTITLCLSRWRDLYVI